MSPEPREAPDRGEPMRRPAVPLGCGTPGRVCRFGWGWRARQGPSVAPSPGGTPRVRVARAALPGTNVRATCARPSCSVATLRAKQVKRIVTTHLTRHVQATVASSLRRCDR